ncbi:MAG: hypothetical protein L6Q69_16025 [Zoogloea sp.]|nr:hypothetical protein [Zoogloea sp.]
MRQSASGTHAHAPAPADTPATLSTAEFAALNHVKPNTVRQRLCDTASFYGIRPVKLASRRLLWPAIMVMVTVDGPTVFQVEGGHHA